MTKSLPRAADPIVAVHTVTRVQCPAELRGVVPAKPLRPAGGTLAGDAATLAWVGLLARWGEGLFGRLTDAARPCS